MQEKQVYLVDCETQPFDGMRTDYKPFCWGILWEDEIKEHFLVFEKTSEFIDFVKDNEGIYYAHNGGKFDWYFITEYIEATSDMLWINGRLVKFQIANSELRDSYSILPIPLSAYKKDKFDYDLLNNYDANKEKIWKYLYNDCRYLADLVLTFRKLYGDAISTPSAALAFWKRQNDNIKTTDYKTDSEVYDKFYRRFYFGGRCECRIRGVFNNRFDCYDINSAYPFAMLSDHPFGYHDTQSIYEKDIIGKSFVTLRAQQTNGAFPYRLQSGKIAFPNDGELREYSITGHEFIAARELGMLKGNYKILSVRNHTSTINFKKYVEHFFAIKREAKKDSPEYILAKLFANSLYGKFAQNFQDFKEYCLADAKSGCMFTTEENEIERIWHFVTPFNSKLGLYESEPLRGKWLNVAISASITGFVRAYLLRAIKSSDNFLYCDTDSIFCTRFNGVVGSELGQWKHEGTFSKGYFCGRKMYYAESIDERLYKNKYAHKGVKLNKSDYERICNGEEIEYKFESPSISLRKKGISYVTRKVRIT
jgi:hypothetical protein